MLTPASQNFLKRIQKKFLIGSSKFGNIVLDGMVADALDSLAYSGANDRSLQDVKFEATVASPVAATTLAWEPAAGDTVPANLAVGDIIEVVGPETHGSYLERRPVTSFTAGSVGVGDITTTTAFTADLTGSIVRVYGLENYFESVTAAGAASTTTVYEPAAPDVVGNVAVGDYMAVVGPVGHGALGNIRRIASFTVGGVGVGDITVAAADAFDAQLDNAFVRTFKPFWPRDIELNVVAQTTITSPLPIGGTRFTVANPYGISNGDVGLLCDLSAGSSEVVTVVKSKTSGNVILAAGPAAAYAAGDVLLVFGTDKASMDQSDSAGADGAPVHAEDMVQLLTFLQQAWQHDKPLTATGGSTSTIVDGAGTFTPGAEVGNIVTIVYDAAGAGADPEGFSAEIIANTGTTLALGAIRDATGTLTGEVLPAAVAAGDIYVITPSFLTPYIEALSDTVTEGDVRPIFVPWAFNANMADPGNTVYASGGANSANPLSIGVAALHTFLERAGLDWALFPGFMSISNGLADNVHPVIATGGVPITGPKFVVAEEVGAAATEVVLVAEPKSYDTHLPNAGNAVLVKGPFASVTPTATNAIAVDVVVVATRADNVLTITGKDPTPYPPGSYLIMNTGASQVKHGYAASVDKSVFMDYLQSVIAYLALGIKAGDVLP